MAKETKKAEKKVEKEVVKKSIDKGPTLAKIVFLPEEGKKYQLVDDSFVDLEDATEIEPDVYKLKDGSLIKLVTQF